MDAWIEDMSTTNDGEPLLATTLPEEIEGDIYPPLASLGPESGGDQSDVHDIQESEPSFEDTWMENMQEGDDVVLLPSQAQASPSVHPCNLMRWVSFHCRRTLCRRAVFFATILGLVVCLVMTIPLDMLPEAKNSVAHLSFDGGIMANESFDFSFNITLAPAKTSRLHEVTLSSTGCTIRREGSRKPDSDILRLLQSEPIVILEAYEAQPVKDDSGCTCSDYSRSSGYNTDLVAVSACETAGDGRGCTWMPNAYAGGNCSGKCIPRARSDLSLRGTGTVLSAETLRSSMPWDMKDAKLVVDCAFSLDLNLYWGILSFPYTINVREKLDVPETGTLGRIVASNTDRISLRDAILNLPKALSMGVVPSDNTRRDFGRRASGSSVKSLLFQPKLPFMKDYSGQFRAVYIHVPAVSFDMVPTFLGSETAYNYQEKDHPPYPFVTAGTLPFTWVAVVGSSGIWWEAQSSPARFFATCTEGGCGPHMFRSVAGIAMEAVTTHPLMGLAISTKMSSSSSFVTSVFEEQNVLVVVLPPETTRRSLQEDPCAPGRVCVMYVHI